MIIFFIDGILIMIKRINPIAKILQLPLFRNRVIPSKKKYNRKKDKHNDRNDIRRRNNP